MEVDTIRLLTLGASRVGKTRLLSAICEVPGEASKTSSRSSTHGCFTDVSLVMLDGKELFVEWLEVGGNAYNTEAAEYAFLGSKVDGIMIVVDASAPADVSYASACATLSSYAQHMSRSQSRAAGGDAEMFAGEIPALEQSIALAVSKHIEALPVLVVATKIDIAAAGETSWAPWLLWGWGSEAARTDTSARSWPTSWTTEPLESTRAKLDVIIGRDERSSSSTTMCGCALRRSRQFKCSKEVTIATAAATAGRVPFAALDAFILGAVQGKRQSHTHS